MRERAIVINRRKIFLERLYKLQVHGRITMKREWRPSNWGQLLTISPDWRLLLENDTLVLSVNGRERLREQIGEKSTVVVNKGTYWAELTFQSHKFRPLKVDGLPMTG